ncbi:hypothetical protein L915_14416 [Phytophthora nicotianae]|uniref:Uncharacterized protein n=2 Tax=Phytophthora nicotianae TaxID=4792 RepID=V9EK36_PHYNI|nr:hypothetical protein F443_14838 [Phytophthora nicotianae P1569]ETK79747.1 hypothetical protein L915_14416 [Phytophthora nicotianae]
MIEDTTRWLEVTVQPEKDYLATAESFDSGSADIPAQAKSPTIKDLSLLLGLDQGMVNRKPRQANWCNVWKQRFEATLADNHRKNNKRIEQFYNPRDTVMLRVPNVFLSKTKGYCSRPVHDQANSQQLHGQH